MIILASVSPRRKELLSLLTRDFIVVPSSVDETTDINDAQKRVEYLAALKARNVAAAYPNDIVIGADTVVAIDGQILEKPKDNSDAARMIKLLQGKTHLVYSGVCVIHNSQEQTLCCATEVSFAPVSDMEIEKYIQTESVLDKAGAYAIQGGAAKFITGIKGDYFNVVGLPLRPVYEILNKTGAF